MIPQWLSSKESACNAKAAGNSCLIPAWGYKFSTMSLFSSLSGGQKLIMGGNFRSFQPGDGTYVTNFIN